MLHLAKIQEHPEADIEDLVKKASGRYYTGEFVGRRLASIVACQVSKPKGERVLNVLDPFGGDGRLIEWLIDAAQQAGIKRVAWKVTVLDVSDVGFAVCEQRLLRLRKTGAVVEHELRITDAFLEAVALPSTFDVVITNPPWELLKPDRRELERLSPQGRDSYVRSMREYDLQLASGLPMSQPKRKFAGWGTNLSRVGLEASLQFAKQGGIVGVVMPASFLADEQSVALRKHALTNHAMLDLAYFPAEQKHYGGADVESITMVLAKGGPAAKGVPLETYGEQRRTTIISLDGPSLERVDHVLPIRVCEETANLARQLSDEFPRWAELESGGVIWAGRELDETGSTNWLAPLSDATPPFIRGRMIGRFQVSEQPLQGVAKVGWSATASVNYQRIVWRDVSRPNQKRRMIATLVPPGWVAGNSLGVLYFRGRCQTMLRAFLAVMNSTSFEFQLRSYLATGHVTLGALRKVAVPSETQLSAAGRLAAIVDEALAGDGSAEARLDAYVAREVYGLSRDQYSGVLSQFPKLDSSECECFLRAFELQ